MFSTRHRTEQASLVAVESHSVQTKHHISRKPYDKQANKTLPPCQVKKINQRNNVTRWKRSVQSVAHKFRYIFFCSMSDAFGISTVLAVYSRFTAHHISLCPHLAIKNIPIYIRARLYWAHFVGDLSHHYCVGIRTM